MNYCALIELQSRTGGEGVALSRGLMMRIDSVDPLKKVQTGLFDRLRRPDGDNSCQKYYPVFLTELGAVVSEGGGM